MRSDPTPHGLSASLFAQLLLPVQRFFRTEASAGIVLAAATCVALVWVNAFDEESYRAIVDARMHLEIGRFGVAEPLVVVINDALMTVFFFVVGLEIKHELSHGHLRTPRRALLPLVAAAGGMLVPAAIYAAFNAGEPSMRGWAIPVATDIAFAAGVLTLFKARVAPSVPVFLVALAIFDDIGGVLVIAAFYGDGIHAVPLILAPIAAALGTAVLRRSTNPLVVIVIGVVLWLLFHAAGLHATLAGVALGLMLPARAKRSARDVLGELHAHAGDLVAKPPDESIDNAEVQSIEAVLVRMEPPVLRFVRLLHPWVAFGIVPLFAFANAGVRFVGVPLEKLIGPTLFGVVFGLVVGKLAGVFFATWIAMRLKLSSLPDGMDRRDLVGVSALAGIGFTVALFIANLAFAGEPQLLTQAKIGILAGSACATLIGAAVVATRRRRIVDDGAPP